MRLLAEISNEQWLGQTLGKRGRCKGVIFNRGRTRAKEAGGRLKLSRVHRVLGEMPLMLPNGEQGWGPLRRPQLGMHGVEQA
jgi:hypothetical protein